MKLIVDIPEEQYKYLAKIADAGKEPLGYFERVIMRGTPLPKVHGVMKYEICIQDDYDKRILARRYGNVFDCNNCGRSWIACKDDIIEGYELYVKLRCPYCHNMIDIPRNFNWF